MIYQIKFEIHPNNPNLKCEESVNIFSFKTKKEAHLEWVNSMSHFISINTMFPENVWKKDIYKIVKKGKIREVIDIRDNSVCVRCTKLY